jgi:hypothetical protein
MKMHDVEFADLVMKRPAERRRPIESSDQGTREISDLNGIKIHGRSDWSGRNSRPVDISSEDLQFVPSCGECAAEAVDGKNWSPVSHGWQIARNYVKNSHAPTR